MSKSLKKEKSVKKTRTVEEIVSRINNEGFHVSSLFQMLNNFWMCSLRPKDKTTTANGQGCSIVEALEMAYKHARHDDAWDFSNNVAKTAKAKLMKPGSRTGGKKQKKRAKLTRAKL